MRVAAIDIGTNTVRLLVRDGGETIDRGSRITRLGQGVDASKELGEEPMRRTLEAAKEFVDRSRAAGVERVVIAGTSALRDARNRDEFSRAVLQTCGHPLEILAGADEGRTAYEGATSWLDGGDHVVCDIGGGSTELITRDDAVSADIGAVRVRERYLKEDPPSGGSVDAARRAVRGILVGLDARTRFGTGGLVGVAGTIITLAALDADPSTYDTDVVHGYTLSLDAAKSWSERLNSMTAEEIKGFGAVDPGRADVIGAGAIVLETVMEVTGHTSMTVSERDILDGLVLRELRRLRS